MQNQPPQKLQNKKPLQIFKKIKISSNF